jgi:hypothetical protein
MGLDDATRKMLESWEVKHGLLEIKRRLDDGLFAPDEQKRRLCYAWVTGRQWAPKVWLVCKVIVGSAAVVSAFAALVDTFK